MKIEILEQIDCENQKFEVVEKSIFYWNMYEFDIKKKNTDWKYVSMIDEKRNKNNIFMTMEKSIFQYFLYLSSKIFSNPVSST